MMIALVFASLVLGGADPGPVTVELLPVRPEALAEMPRGQLKVEAEGQATSYSGVPLAALLAKRAKPVEGMPGLRELAGAVILVRGEDGYQAAVSAAAVAMDPKGERYLLSTSRDGQPRKPQLIIPGDPKRARWVRDIESVRLVRLDQVVPPKP